MKQIIINVPDNATNEDIIVAVKNTLNPVIGNEKWVVVRDAYKGESLGIGILVMVDRRKTKDTWWTSDNIDIAMVFNNKHAAKRKANSLRIGNPKVMPYSSAKFFINEQAESIAQVEIENDAGDYMYHGDS